MSELPSTTLAELSDEELCLSLASARCPSCGKRKTRAHTFCGACYFRLRQDARSALYARLGNGYGEAVISAMKLLGRTVFFTAPADGRNQ